MKEPPEKEPPRTGGDRKRGGQSFDGSSAILKPQRPQAILISSFEGRCRFEEIKAVLRQPKRRRREAISLRTQADRMAKAHSILVELIGDTTGLDDRHPAFEELLDTAVGIAIRVVELAHFPRPELSERIRRNISTLKTTFNRVRLDTERSARAG